MRTHKKRKHVAQVKQQKFITQHLFFAKIKRACTTLGPDYEAVKRTAKKE